MYMHITISVNLHFMLLSSVRRVRYHCGAVESMTYLLYVDRYLLVLFYVFMFIKYFNHYRIEDVQFLLII